MPYGKFAHGFYRLAALLKNSIEKRQQNHLQFGSDWAFRYLWLKEV